MSSEQLSFLPGASPVLREQSPFFYPFPHRLLPAHFSHTPGTPSKDAKDVPPLFRPLKIRNSTLKNRIAVSPMCQYSSPDGYLTDWHLRHLGNFAVGGAALIFTEATAVLPEGRITPYCAGIYHEGHVAAHKRVVDFIHANDCLAGLQVAHAGRKASTLPPFLGGAAPNGPRVAVAVPEEYGGWPKSVVGASSIPWSETFYVPTELSKEEIQKVVKAFAVAAKRADEAGYDYLEIHGAHGYLISSFLSPISNQRKDEYGGSLENRIRLPIEVVRSIKSVWPSHKPLWFRVSCSEWVPGGWNIEDTVALAKRLKEEGVDVLDCSSGGNDPRQTEEMKKFANLVEHPQIGFAERIKKEVPGLLIGAVGLITDPFQANSIISKNQADVVLLGRQIQREPYWSYRAARELGVDIGWAPQIAWGSKLRLDQDDRSIWKGTRSKL